MNRTGLNIAQAYIRKVAKVLGTKRVYSIVKQSVRISRRPFPKI